MTYIPRLKKEYKERIIAALKEEFGYKNVMQVPKLEKIVVSHLSVNFPASLYECIDYKNIIRY